MSNFEDWFEANLSKPGLEAEDFSRSAAPAILEGSPTQDNGFFVLLRTRGH
jgi:hypothetical protein